MRNKDIITALLALMLPAGIAFSQVPYDIHGTWATGAGKKLYLQNFPSKTPEGETVDSATVDANGHFSIKGSLPEMQLLMLTDAEGKRGYRMLMGDGKSVEVNISDVKYNYRHPEAAYTIKATTEADTIEHCAAHAIMAYWASDFMRKMTGGMAESSLQKAIEQHNAADSAEYAEKIAEARQAEGNEKAAFLSSYGNTLAAPFFIEMNMMKEGNAAVMADFYDRMGDRAKHSAKGQQIKRDIDINLRLAPGAEAPDFTLETKEGKKISLSSLRGHVVIVDFWASWCVPCIAEMPTVKELYAQYKDRGLEVLGVSMDHVRASWLKAIDKHQLPWLHVSSLKGMQRCPVADLYQVHGIPQLFIIGKDGRIIAKGLRGEELKNKVDELFAKEK